MPNKEIKEIVFELISKRREGGYWDFKEKWHNNKAELLHDIICLANNLENHDAYLIFGINDNAQIIGLFTTENALNTQQLNDFLRSKKFVGDFRPEVVVDTLLVDAKTLHVVTIKNSRNTPFVLREKYDDGKKCVREGNIYTRIQDSNTPIDSTADNDKVENLFKKRFRLDATPLTKLKYYLSSPEHWIISDEYSGRYYYEFEPEFSLVLLGEDTKHQDFLSKIFPDKDATWERADFKVYDHVIHSQYHVGLDGYRMHIAVPHQEFIPSSNRKKWFKYFYVVQNSLLWFFNKFIQTHSVSKHLEIFSKLINQHIIIFRSDEERTQFHNYLEKNPKLIVSGMKKIDSARSISDEWTKNDELDYKSTQAIKTIYDNWKKKAQ